jgi:hypothetical protein
VKQRKRKALTRRIFSAGLKAQLPPAKAQRYSREGDGCARVGLKGVPQRLKPLARANFLARLKPCPYERGCTGEAARQEGGTRGWKFEVRGGCAGEKKAKGGSPHRPSRP